MLTSVRFTFARNVDEEFLAAHKEDSKIRRHQLGELKQLDQDFEKKLREIDKAHKTESVLICPLLENQTIACA